MPNLAVVSHNCPHPRDARQAAIGVRLPRLAELVLMWGTVEAMLAPAVARSGGCFQTIDVLRLAMAGQMGIWFIERFGRLVACAVTDVRQFPRKRMLEVVFIGGSGVWDWHGPLLAALDAHAGESGCDAIMGAGRPGWSRFGFENRGAIMVRDLA